jgi:putative spermidine/putrescine transport system substrate-binding protein
MTLTSFDLARVRWFRSIGLAAILASGLQIATARDLTVVSPGGAAQVQQKKAIYDPFTKATGIPVRGDQWDNKLARLRTQIESGTISWDVVQVSSSVMQVGCDEGLFETVDWSGFKGNRADYDPHTFHRCGVYEVAWSTVLAYDGDRFPNGPKTWADFWNVEKWPGKRGLILRPERMLEIALLADGVALQDIYKVLSAPGGMDRAFKKLDELKPNILWYQNYADATQRLASGEVVMTSVPNGRITVLNQENKRNFKIAWDAGHLLTNEWFTILKGSPNKKEALQFLQFWLTPEPEAAYAQGMTMGGPARKSYALLSSEQRESLPSSDVNQKYAVPVDSKFWADNQESIEERFAAWSSKK